MTGPHPDELTLLDYVEGDLPAPERDALTAHLETCPECARSAAAAERGRDALTAAAPLQFPADRQASLAADLPALPSARKTYVSPMRLVTVLAPVAALVAIAVGIAQLDLGGGGNNGGDGGGGSAAPASADRDGSGGAEDESAGGGSAPLVPDRPVARVNGPPSEVVTFLRERGFRARLQGTAVLVKASDASKVTAALATRRRGHIEVYIEGE